MLSYGGLMVHAFVVGVFLGLVMNVASASASPEKAESRALDALVAKVVQRHPSVLSELAQRQAAESDLEAARLQRYPSMSFQTESSGSKPSGLLGVEQVLWSGGRLQGQIDLAQGSLELRDMYVQEVRYGVALRVVEAWQALWQAVSRLEAIEATQTKLSQFDALMRRRVDAGVSAPVELELVTARRVQARVEMDAAQSAARTAHFRLESLLGSVHGRSTLLGSESLLLQVARLQALWQPPPDDRIAQLVERHPVVRRALAQVDVARHEVEIKQADRWPQMYAKLQKPVGSAANASRSFYLGLRYQPGAGFSTLTQAQAAQARAQAQDLAVGASRREVAESMQSELQEWLSARSRAQHMNQSVLTTGLVLESYERQFIAGRRSWQEVLNAVRENAEVRMGLVDARAVFVGLTHRLRVRTGEMAWQQESTVSTTP